MVIGGVLYDGDGVRIQDVIVTFPEPAPAPGHTGPWSGTLDLEPHSAVLLLHQGASLRLCLLDGREGWCSLTGADGSPGSLAAFRGSGPLEAPALAPAPR